MSLFEMNDSLKPLAERMKPTSLSDFYGQENIINEGKILRRLIQSDRLTSLVLYGPPGCGKTSLANIISKLTKSDFATLNAVTDGLKELREIIKHAKAKIDYHGIRTLVFIDEIHRFNKTQQDGLLPAVERGYIILIGATTFNPYFYLVPALASRTTIIEMKPLNSEALTQIFKNALSDKERGLGNKNIIFEEGVIEYLVEMASGDSRRLLNALEIGVLSTPENDNSETHITLEIAKEMIQTRAILYDRDGDYHYDIISAFIKSMRGSDVDAALYYLARMLEAGEDIRFIARRCAIFAAEDVGLAEPFALTLAASAFDLVEKIGMPESDLILSELVTFLAGSPKSNSTTIAINNAKKFIKEGKALEVPNHLKCNHYKAAKKLGRGEGYKYPHNFSGHFVDQEYMSVKEKFYTPLENGKEKNIKSYLEWIKQISEKSKKS